MTKRISTGRVFQRHYRDRKTGERKLTSTWFVRYYLRGKPIELSAETEDYDEALAFLRQKLATAATHAEYSEHPERVRMDQLFELLLEDYRLQNRHTTYDVRKRIEKHLGPFFGRLKVQAVTPAAIRRYIDARRRDDPRPENATINKELAYLRRALNLGAQEDPPLVLRVPHITMLRVDNVRTGLITHEQYRAVRDLLPAYARIALVIGYHTGARKGEIRQVRRADIDFGQARITLRRGTTKNDEPRYLPIYGDMAAEIEMAIDAGDKRCPWLVQDGGKQVYDFEKAWATACRAAGVSGALFHDLRRTAVGLMIDAGLSESQAMEITGHKTRSMFERYHIRSAKRLQQSAAKIEAHVRSIDAETPRRGKDSVN